MNHDPMQRNGSQSPCEVIGAGRAKHSPSSRRVVTTQTLDSRQHLNRVQEWNSTLPGYKLTCLHHGKPMGSPPLLWSSAHWEGTGKCVWLISFQLQSYQQCNYFESLLNLFLPSGNNQFPIGRDTIRKLPVSKSARRGQEPVRLHQDGPWSL